MKLCWENNYADLGQRDAFWRRVIGVKYGSQWGGWCLSLTQVFMG